MDIKRMHSEIKLRYNKLNSNHKKDFPTAYLDDFIKKAGHFLIYTSHTREYKDFADIIYSIEGRNVKRDI